MRIVIWNLQLRVLNERVIWIKWIERIDLSDRLFNQSKNYLD